MYFTNPSVEVFMFGIVVKGVTGRPDSLDVHIPQLMADKPQNTSNTAIPLSGVLVKTTEGLSHSTSVNNLNYITIKTTSDFRSNYNYDSYISAGTRVLIRIPNKYIHDARIVPND